MNSTRLRRPQSGSNVTILDEWSNFVDRITPLQHDSPAIRALLDRWAHAHAQRSPAQTLRSAEHELRSVWSAARPPYITLDGRSFLALPHQQRVMTRLCGQPIYFDLPF